VLVCNVVGCPCVTGDLDIADKPLQHLSHIDIAVLHWINVDGGPVLALVVGDLLNELRDAVDRDARTVLLLALRTDMRWPLLA
jgi:hypothetical protein